MATFRVIFHFIAILFYLCHGMMGDSDLRSALDAINRRQKELAEYEEEQQQYGYNPYDQLNGLAFLNVGADDRNYEKEYLDDDSYDLYNKRLTSAFRERLEKDHDKQLEDIAKNFYHELEGDDVIPGGLNRNDIKEWWARNYGNGYYGNNGLNKRLYPIYGMKNVGLRKREKYLNANDDPVYSIHHHSPRSDNSDYQIGYLRNHYLGGSMYGAPRSSYSGNKRFLVAKRSSPNKDEKRSVKKQTDPQVEKDLRSIFGNEEKQQINDNTLEDEPSTTQNPNKDDDASLPRKIEKKDKPKMDSNKDAELNKEIFAPVVPQNKKPLQLKKKSIDWSDYFGLDRRKKSDPNNGLDKEWLMERYHKAIAITAKKRNAELPLQSFRNRGVLLAEDKEEQKINEMEKKLEKLEDKIVEDALKFTGAHQDDSDSKEIQQIKDNIISKLAQAYNIEKMRNALEEYKLEVEDVRKKLNDKSSEYAIEEKRVSVPRKQAVDDSQETVVADNNIKCTTSENCHEQNYKLSSDVLDLYFNNFECPAIQAACNDVASIVGYYGHVFEAACHIHQMCLLCSNNSWFSPTRQCNSLFLTKAFELCIGKEECKKEARQSVKYLLDVNKSLQAQTALIDRCELQCPDTGVMSK